MVVDNHTDEITPFNLNPEGSQIAVEKKNGKIFNSGNGKTTKEKTTHVTPFTSKLFVIFYVSRSESLCFPYRKRKAPLRETYVSRQRNIKIILTSEKISFGIFSFIFSHFNFLFYSLQKFLPLQIETNQTRFLRESPPVCVNEKKCY